MLVGGPEGTMGTLTPFGCCRHPPVQAGSSAKVATSAGQGCRSGGTCAGALPCPRAHGCGCTSPGLLLHGVLAQAWGRGQRCCPMCTGGWEHCYSASCGAGSAWVISEMAMRSSIHRVPGQWGWVLLSRAGSAPALVLWHWWQHLPMASHWPSFSFISRRDLDINRPGTVPNAKTLR